MAWCQAGPNKIEKVGEKHSQAAGDKTFANNHKVHEKFMRITQNVNHMKRQVENVKKKRNRQTSILKWRNGKRVFYCSNLKAIFFFLVLMSVHFYLYLHCSQLAARIFADCFEENLKSFLLGACRFVCSDFPPSSL